MMTPEQLREIRRASGLTLVEFGRALGYRGRHNNVAKQVRDMERGRRSIPARAATLAASLAGRREEAFALLRRGDIT